LNRSENGTVYSTSPEYIGLLTTECYFRVGSNFVCCCYRHNHIGGIVTSHQEQWHPLNVSFPSSNPNSTIGLAGRRLPPTEDTHAIYGKISEYFYLVVAMGSKKEVLLLNTKVKETEANKKDADSKINCGKV
jgi:hypothetical protein